VLTGVDGSASKIKRIEMNQNDLLKFESCQVISCQYRESYPQTINNREIDGESIARTCRFAKLKSCPFKKYEK